MNTPLTLHEYILEVISFHSQRPEGDPVKLKKYDQFLRIGKEIDVLSQFALIPKQETSHPKDDLLQRLQKVPTNLEMWRAIEFMVTAFEEGA